ncbi:MAG: hypothetical protein OXG96_00100 [Acidobacteria bacterium]|nr:hypothetical protein [Acidobacteriota bacterium]
MKRNLVLLNLALLAGAGLLSWTLLGQWRQFEAEHRLDRPDSGSRQTAADPEGPPPLSFASSFAAIVDHHLFNPDRSNDLPEELADGPQEELQPAPVLMGMMGLGAEEVALMVSGASGRSGGLYRRLKVGEALDGYTLVRIETDRVVMQIGDREVRVGMDRRTRKPRRTSRTAGSAQSAAPTTTGVGARRSSANRRQGSSRRGPARSARRRATDLMNTPVGTVQDGKRLVEQQTPFGPVRVWVEEKSK